MMIYAGQRLRNTLLRAPVSGFTCATQAASTQPFTDRAGLRMTAGRALLGISLAVLDTATARENTGSNVVKSQSLEAHQERR